MTCTLAEAVGRDVPRETEALLQRYAELLRAASTSQNLISASTDANLWERHILDSAQLLRLAPRLDANWVDVGSGAGLPGIPLAILSGAPVTLVEPRRLRAEFLTETARALGLASVSVISSRVERARGQFDVITGRAVAALDAFLTMTSHLSHPRTFWILPKGRNAQSELEVARRSWHCAVERKPSCTDPLSQILVLSRVGKKQ